MGITRGEFIKAGSILAVNAGLNLMGIRDVKAKQMLDEDKKEINKTEFVSKAEYVTYIEPIKNKYRKIIEENDILEGYKILSQEERVKAFDMYFPMYYAAQLKYQVPWLLLLLTHAHETTFSLDKNPDSYSFRGAMQRSPRYYPETQVIQASKGWGFLAELPQRYNRAGRISDTADWGEILFAASKLRDDANTYFDGNPVLAMMKYCNEKFAWERIEQFNKYSPLFN